MALLVSCPAGEQGNKGFRCNNPTVVSVSHISACHWQQHCVRIITLYAFHISVLWLAATVGQDHANDATNDAAMGTFLDRLVGAATGGFTDACQSYMKALEIRQEPPSAWDSLSMALIAKGHLHLADLADKHDLAALKASPLKFL